MISPMSHQFSQTYILYFNSFIYYFLKYIIITPIIMIIISVYIYIINTLIIVIVIDYYYYYIIIYCHDIPMISPSKSPGPDAAAAPADRQLQRLRRGSLASRAARRAQRWGACAAASTRGRMVQCGAPKIATLW